MTPKDFDLYLESMQKKITSILKSKAGEYAMDNDRFHNFKTASRINEETPAKAAWGMATKHLISVQDLIEHRLELSKPMIAEKFIDMINYLILISAMLEEELYAKQKYEKKQKAIQRKKKKTTERNRAKRKGNNTDTERSN